MPQSLVEKWSPATLDEGFVPFPKKLLRAMHRLFIGVDSTKDIAALLAIVDFRRPNVTRRPSLAYLAFVSGLDEEQFRAALNRLEALGYIRVGGDFEGLDISLSGLLDAVERESK
jgi:hypothetical protein